MDAEERFSDMVSPQRIVLFILSGLLCTINLYYEKSVQILVLGFFYFINGILEAIDPITYYLIEKQK